MEQGNDRAGIRLAHGPRAVEAALLEELSAAAREARERPERLGLPLRVVVPSTSLRLHLSARLVAAGGAVAGVRVQTLHGLALEILERAGGPPPPQDLLFPALVRQVAARDPLLRGALDELVDGYGPVRSVVDDLLDAGFETDATEPLAEALAEAAGGAAVARARALVGVAAEVWRRLGADGVGHRSRLVAEATDALERDAERALPARGVWIHGFAEVTGRRADLLEALVRRRGARVWLDAPRDPADPARADPGTAFLQRLRERMEGLAPLEEVREAVAPAVVAAFRAPGAAAEAREVAERVLALHEDAGVPYASIGVVARDLAGHRGALRRQLTRLGVPFSGVGEPGSVTPEAARAAALLALLEEGPRIAVDRWLDAVAAFGDVAGAAPPDAPLRLALRHVGAVRLSDVAGLEPPPRGVPLPAALRRNAPEEDAAPGEGAAPRRVPGARLAEARSAARALLERLEALRAPRGADQHAAILEELARVALGWSESAEARVAIATLRSELPGGFALDAADFTTLVRRRLERAGRRAIGGAGGGVQLLSVMEARARTFDALFVIGLNRDVFPRSVSEDALLPDDLRGLAGVVLPDLPIKRTGHDEERYLFAQLAAASPRLTLSWQVCDDDGRARAPSSFVERPGLWPGGPDAPCVASIAARGAAAVVPSPGSALLPADERAAGAGLSGDRAAFAASLERALGELPELQGLAAAELAAARCRVLDELEGRGEAWQALGPYLGRIGVGAADAPDTPDGGGPGGPLYVTTLEGLARCGWQALLRRVLRLEPPVDPLQALPGLDRRLLGIAVHGALAELVRAAVGSEPADLEALREAVPARIAWPRGAALEGLAREAARAALREEGIVLAGLEWALAQQVVPYLERAREIDAEDPALGVVGAEISGSFSSEGTGRLIGFRVDRVDRVEAEEGGAALRLTDYKTGAPLSDAKKPDTRRRHFLASVGAGQALQAPVYARGSGGGGRFLYLDPELPRDRVEFATDADDPEMQDGLQLVLETTVGAWQAGAFPPRLLDDKLEKEAAVCARCEVAAACLRKDSGVRRRLARWLELARERAPGEPAARAYRDLWLQPGPGR